MADQKIVHDDDEKGQFIDLYRITRSDLALLGLTPEQIHLDEPDELIRLYEMTFEHVGPDEYYSICLTQTWGKPEEVRRVARKDKIWHIRWSVAYRLPEAISKKQADGEDITRYLDWLHAQLTRTFARPKPREEPLPEPGLGGRLLGWLLDQLTYFGIDNSPRVVLPPAVLDGEILGWFVCSMGHHEVFSEHTWEPLLVAGSHLRGEGYAHHLVLLGKVYTKYHPPCLKKYLEEASAWPAACDDRTDALIKVARIILEEKKLKVVNPPYSVGIAIDG